MTRGTIEKGGNSFRTHGSPFIKSIHSPVDLGLLFFNMSQLVYAVFIRSTRQTTS